MTSEPLSHSLSNFFGFFNRKGRVYSLREAIMEIINEASHRASNSQETPELDRQERALLINVLHLRHITVDDVMIPRADIVAMPDNVSFEEALHLVRQDHHSRMPVYHEQLDDIVGMIHVKDLITHLDERSSFDINKLLRQPLLIAPNLPVLDLQLQMRQRRTHMALVIDEYGSIDGLVTIEDLIEKIIGDISDEHDDPVEIPWVERPDGSVDVDARLSVEELEQHVGRILTQEEREAEIETVGGLVFHLAEHVPARDEVLTHPSGLEFRVLEADARHILTLRMRLPTDWEQCHTHTDQSKSSSTSFNT